MNHIYRLVWCQSRRLLVVASELASSGHGNGASAGQTVDARRRVPARQLLFTAVLGAVGLLFASGASAQSSGDARLDDLQALMAKYSAQAAAAAPQAVAATPANAAIVSAAVTPAIGSAAPAAPATVRRVNPARAIIARPAQLAAAQPAAPMIVPTLSPVAAATASIPVFASSAADAKSLAAADHTAVALAPPAQGQLQGSSLPVVDVADRRSALASRAQVALQSSSIQIPDAPIPPVGESSLALPAIKPTVLPVAARLTTALNVTPLEAVIFPAAVVVPAVADPAALVTTSLPAAKPITVSPVIGASNAGVAAATGNPAVTDPAVTQLLATNPVAANPVVSSLVASTATLPAGVVAEVTSPAGVATVPRTVATVATPASTVAADVLNEAAVAAPPSLATVADVADRRLAHATSAMASSTAKPTDLLANTDSLAAPVTALSAAGVTPSTFAVRSFAATSPSLLASSATPIGSAAITPQAVPVFPTPGAQPTGLIVGNGGVVGTATQLLGPTSNSLFSGGNGYVTNGSLQVSNANFSQGYSVVDVLGVPLLTLNPVGTLLTSTTGAVVGGTGVNSHLTLLGGVTSNNYISNINNGGPNALLGLALPTAAPAYAATCLGALVATVACYGVNAAQDYQVLVGDGATANGSKEVVIGTNASHTLPTVSADVAFPGAGRNDPNNPTGVPTADYAARLGHSVVVGDNATGSANAQTIIGAEASASAANSVALGFQSAANRGGAIGYAAYGLAAPQTAVGEVSIGSVGAERQITNVAAGSVGTDAVNVLQLQAVVLAAAGDSVQYDNAGHTSVTLSSAPPSIDGGVTGGTTVTNLHQGSLTATSTDAVNGAQLFATNNSITNIVNSSSKYYQANSAGTGSSAVGLDSLAAGPLAVSTGPSSVAIGNGATTGARNGIAIGTGASATFANSVALGNGSVTGVGALANYAAPGLAAPQTSLGEVNVGTRQITGVAAGLAATDAVNVGQLAGVSALAANGVQYDTTVPPDTRVTLAGPASIDGGVTGGTTITNLHQGALNATSTDAVNGSQLFATNSTINNVVNTSSKYYQANSVGVGSAALGINSLAAGPAAVATGAGSIAEGTGATTLGTNSVALGSASSSVSANSVALGAGSQALRGPQLLYPGYGLLLPQNSVGEVSVGTVGAERQITNVAAGQLGTDAVNVAQLQGVSASAANAVQYDTAVPLRASVTLAGPASTDGGLTGGTLITNLHRGALTPVSTDAINGAQLYGWALDPNNPASNTSLYNTFINTPANKYLSVASILPGAATSGLNSIALGPVASATADNALALGTGANANMANSIALGSGSITTVGARLSYVGYGLAAPQSSAGELNLGNRQITGVAAASTPDGAVNLAQLQAVIGASGTPAAASKLAVLYTPDAAGNPTNAVALTGNGTGAPVSITNVAAGAETPTSTAAVNGSQVWHWSQDTTNMYSNTSLYNDITALGSNGGSNKYVQVNSTLAGATASGSNSVAVGPAATASGANSVAVGNGAQATAANSVALGAGSVASRDNTVSVGSPGAERQVTNVASGTADTDAANVGQVNAGVRQAQNWATSYTDQKFGALSSQVQQIGNRANAGVAAAMAMAGLPQAYEPGKSMAAVAAGTFRSESSIAVGVSTISEGGRWVYKMTGSMDSRGDGGVSLGAGMQW